MRAISPIARYSIQLIEAVPKRGMDKSGVVVEYTDSQPVIAQFSQGGLTEWEQIEAIEKFDFSGLPDGVNPLTRVSVFDSEAYVQRFPKAERDKALAQIDERLTELQAIYPSEFMIVEKPAQPAPWPTYDDATLDEILELQMVSGWSPEQIRLYEVENRNRKEVVEAMERLEAEAAGVTEESISVAV